MTDTDLPSDASATRPHRRDDLLTAELDDELALFDPASREMIVLNHSARLVWECCDGSGTTGEIAADIAEVFGVDPHTVREQVERLVVEWRARGLLEPSDRTLP